MSSIDVGVYGGVGNMSLSLTGATMGAPQLSTGILPDHHQASQRPANGIIRRRPLSWRWKQHR
uniref:Uncharacterized protein n=1 Tax=Leersia perrieri TaxID=77586 RepID=A0A0D9XGL1_9ORYZ